MVTRIPFVFVFTLDHYDTIICCACETIGSSNKNRSNDSGNVTCNLVLLYCFGVANSNLFRVVLLVKWVRIAKEIGSLSNHDDNGNKKPTNLHIWQWKTVFFHALHVHFSCFDILKTFSFFLRHEMICFAVVWTTWAYDDKCSILSSIVPSAGSNLIPGQLEYIFQA